VIRKILCAVDFSDNSRKALEKAAAYAAAFSASLHVVHVVPSHRLKERWARWDTDAGKNPEQFESSVDAEVREALSRMIRDAAITSQGELLHGAPPDVICTTAEGGAYDLVVMGARGLSYIEGLIIGSVTETVIKAAPCPVLIVH
jgi:nucleotide-binding universal stress UspA family protein